MALTRTTDKKGLVNLAYALIGESPIDDLADANDPAAVAASAVIDQVILEEQADFPYQELRKTVSPVRDAVFEQSITDAFEYRFALPDDFICPCQDVRGYIVTDEDGNELRHYFEGNYLYSTADTVHLNYVRESDDPSEWWPWQTQMVYHKLSLMLAPSRNKSKTLIEQLLNVYESIVRPRMRMKASVGRTTEKGVKRRPNRYLLSGRGY